MAQNFPNPSSNESGFYEIDSPKQITPASQNDIEVGSDVVSLSTRSDDPPQQVGTWGTERGGAG